jgi:hypothetical protein
MLQKFVGPLYTNGHEKIVFVPGRPFQPSLMFSGKARNLPRSRAPVR